VRTFVASRPCNVAKDWVGSYAITIKRQREQPTGFRDETGLANKTDPVRTANRSNYSRVRDFLPDQ